MARKQKWQFWIDRGGTFTDIVARHPDGQLSSHKLLSDNPECYQEAVIQGIKDCLQDKPISSEEIGLIKMGTTVATNALLERKGEKVLLAITQGFRDSLRIGYQNRPHIFALNIQLPSTLYEEVIEIKERVDARGTVLQPLDEKDARGKMLAAFKKGYRAIAIVLMHAYSFNEHEKKLTALAKQVGFKQVSVSHEVAPVMKLISRGDTTVVDAYLSPVLHRYIYSLQQQLKKIPLFFMQSNGGLANASIFQGKDSILSGPAAGVIGMIKSAEIAGFNQVIGFDMGGTSTDVSHYAGEQEYCYGAEFGGIKIRTPMLLIKTIAAGGGSIIHFDGQRYIVGPDSAGANPGPACYRRGGPLTVTDCNVKLGKIQADFFPQVFGSSAKEGIDVTLVHEKFAALTQIINHQTKTEQTAEQVAEGFLQIAIENMANAIKKISVQRGYDARQYVLNCFGGAAGQHACLVADNLGIKTILIHPLAGVLSAYGMGLAEMSVFKELAIEKPLKRGIISFLRQQFILLKQDAEGKLQQQGKINHKERVHLRYQGSDTVLVVGFNLIHKMKADFTSEHRQKFGFTQQKKMLIVESVSLASNVANHEMVENDEESVQFRTEIPQEKTVTLFTHHVYHHAPIYLRSKLKVGDRIKGCALICEAHSTTVIEPGWQAEVTSKKHLLLTRYESLKQEKIATSRANPVLLEMFNNRFMAIAEQMGEVLKNTATSVNIKERLDFSCALFDAEGELIANAPHIPVHLGSMSESMKELLKAKRKSLHPKDVFITNDPYHGGTHLPDITVITPVFTKEGDKLLFLVGSRGHHADIGGITPGSVPANSKEISEEGVLIRDFRMIKQGHFQEKALRNLLSQKNCPSRNPEQNIADLHAQVAANACGVAGLIKLVEQFGLEVVQTYMDYVRENAKNSVEQLLMKLTDGEFNYFLDDGSKIQVKIIIDKQNKRACFDFSGSSPQHQGNFNAPTAITKAALLYVLRCLIAENIPLNSGSFAPVELIIPPASILDPGYPAAVVAGNVETSQYVVDSLLGAFSIVAASQGTCNNFTFGNNKYQYYETICGGAGAGPGYEGASAVHTHMTNTHLTDPEVLERRFPVILEEFKIRSGSGGKGKYRGGDGVVRRIRFLEPLTANIISSHRKIPPYGLMGGSPGQTGCNRVQRASGLIEELGGVAQVEMHPGDVFIIETPGGGGYGYVSSPPKK